jgi:hypothetical protein
MEYKPSKSTEAAAHYNDAFSTLTGERDMPERFYFDRLDFLPLPLQLLRSTLPPNPSPDLCNKASRGRLPTCRRQQHGNREGRIFPFAST